jgi:hypothetical protein
VAPIVTVPLLAVSDELLATVTEPPAKIVTDPAAAVIALPNSTVTELVVIVGAAVQPVAGVEQPAVIDTEPLAVTGTCDSNVTEPDDTIVTFPAVAPVADTDRPGDSRIPPEPASKVTFPAFAVNDDLSAVGVEEPVGVAPGPTVIAPDAAVAVRTTFPVVARIGELPKTVIEPVVAVRLTPVAPVTPDADCAVIDP